MQAAVEQNGLGARVGWLIRLRWLAAVGVALGTFFSTRVLHMPVQEVPLYTIAVLLALYNAVVLSLPRRFTGPQSGRSRRKLKSVIHLQISVDLIILTFLLHFSGGPENPLVFFFVFHMIIASILLSVWESYLQATLAVTLFGLLLLLESTGLAQHYCLKGLIKYCHYEDGTYQIAGFATFVVTLYLVVYMASYIAVRLRQAEEAQKRANEQLREKDRIKDEYVAHLTHDIKGDLAAIQSCLNVAITDSLEGQAAEFVNHAYRRACKLAAFVRMLLRLTRLKLDGDWEVELFSVAEVIRETIDSIRLTVEEKSLHLECSIDPAGGTVSGSRFSFREAIANLLLNAIKYTPEQGTISVRTEVRAQFVLIEVSDTGIGIPKDDQPRVFTEFYRANNARKMDSNGDGLGLALAKQIIERYAGTIELSSDLGRGTTFHIILPITS